MKTGAKLNELRSYSVLESERNEWKQKILQPYLDVIDYHQKETSANAFSPNVTQETRMHIKAPKWNQTMKATK